MHPSHGSHQRRLQSFFTHGDDVLFVQRDEQRCPVIGASIEEDAATGPALVRQQKQARLAAIIAAPDAQNGHARASAASALGVATDALAVAQSLPETRQRLRTAVQERDGAHRAEAADAARPIELVRGAVVGLGLGLGPVGRRVAGLRHHA